jgi:hypothetical protein
VRPGQTSTPGLRFARPALAAALAWPLLLGAAVAVRAAAPAAAQDVPALQLMHAHAAQSCPARAQSAIGGAQVDMDAIASGPGCAVYAAGTVNLSKSTALYDWGGRAWKHRSSFSGGEYSNLYAITARSATGTWTVGYTDNSVADQTLIERLTSKGWVSYASPSPAGTVANNDLYGVAAAGSSAWAVGADQVTDGSASTALILGWTGKKWVVVHSPAIAQAQDSALFSAAASSPSSAWAVGTAVRGAVSRPLIERFQHNRWAVVSSPAEAGELESVTVISARNAWAVGYRTVAGTDKTLIEHWNGARWSVVSSPNVARADGSSAGNQLRGVAASSATSAYAVGAVESSANSSVEVTLLLHWNGQKWARVASPDPAGTSGTNELQGVSASSASGFWIVGSYLADDMWHSFALHK